MFFSFLFIYLLLAALGLGYCVRTLFSCSERGLLPSCDMWSSHCGASLLQSSASVAVVRGLSYPVACGVFQIRNRTYVLCIGRWILYYWTTKEVLLIFK